MTVFGRDTLITCLQTLLFGPELARTALEVLAELQARDDNPDVDAEPGKIVHELRSGKAAQKWFRTYYGTVDATPLYLVLLSEVWRWTDDAAFVRELKEPALAALRWIDEFGDRDGDGFVEYERRTPRGLENQSWKDSGDSQRFHDGSLAKTPIAPFEVQGYVYDAKLRTAELAREVWRDRPLAERLEREAEELKRRLRRARSGPTRAAATTCSRSTARSGRSTRSARTSATCSGAGSSRAARVDAVVDQLMGDGALVGLGRAHDVDRRRGLQPALVPQRHRLAPRQLPDRARARAHAPLARGAADRAPDARARPRTSATSCPRSSPACRAPRRRSRSPTRPRRARRPGRPGRRCCCCRCCSASQPDRRRGQLETRAPEELPSWAGRSLRLTGHPRLRPRLGRACRARARHR